MSKYTLPKPYLSHSQVSSYFSCPQAYYYRYIDKLPDEAPVAKLSFGTAIHKALEYAFSHRRDKGLLPPNEAVVAAFCDSWAKCKRVRFDSGESWAEYLRIGMAVLRTYMEEVAPTVVPRFTEFEHTVELVDGLTYLGIIDLYTEDETVIDFKTAATAWTVTRAREDNQLTGYALLLLDKLGNLPRETQIHCLVKNPVGVKVVSGGMREPYHLAEYRRTLAHVAECITNGVFYKKTSSWLCQAGRCPFYGVCMQ